MGKIIFVFVLVCLVSGMQALTKEIDIKTEIDQLKKINIEQAMQIQKLTNEFITQKEKYLIKSSNSDVTIGGYGEIGLNSYKDSSRNQIDLKRFVLFFGHRFNDEITFNSEVEWEHAIASASDAGETEIEQAYLNFQLAKNISLKAGLFLMPLGFINESHESPVFYGVERNQIETLIIPTTWREGGVGFSGESDSGFGWAAGLVTGFNFAKFDNTSAPLRGVHQELQLAKAHDVSSYVALKYQVPGVTLGGAIFTGNSGQGNANFKNNSTQPDFTGVDGHITLTELHARLQKMGWDIQALYAQGNIKDTDKIDQILLAFNTLNATSRPYLASEFSGWLVQLAYKVALQAEASFEPFLRYEGYNTQAKMPNGFLASSLNADHVTTAGFSYKPHQQVVIKADYQTFVDNSDNSRLNLGMGYMF